MMTNSTARKRLASPTILPAELVAALSTAENDVLSAKVAGWFVEHAELDRERFLTLVDEAKAVLR